MWNGASIPYESTLERDFLVRTSFSRRVLDIIPQPVRIEYQARSGRVFPYTPDYLVHYRIDKDAPWGTGRPPRLVEVKPREEIRAKWPDMKPKFRAALHYARERGWEFTICDESRIRDQVLANIMFLQRYKRMEFPMEETVWILGNLRDMGQAPFDYLVSRHFFGWNDRAVGISHLWHLLATGQVECDMSQPLNNQTIFWVPTDD